MRVGAAVRASLVLGAARPCTTTPRAAGRLPGGGRGGGRELDRCARAREPVLIAAGVLAARGRLDIASVLLVAWRGATAGGIIGWLIG